MASNTPFFKKGHEVGFGVGHFLRAVRDPHWGKAPPKPFHAYVIPIPLMGSVSLIKGLLSLGQKAAGNDFKSEIENIVKDQQCPSDMLSCTTRFLHERDDLNLDQAFLTVARQIGWQARSEDFEGENPKRTFSPPQVFLRGIPEDIRVIREWADKNSYMAIPQYFSKSLKRLEL